MSLYLEVDLDGTRRLVEVSDELIALERAAMDAYARGECEDCENPFGDDDSPSECKPTATAACPQAGRP